MSLTAACWNGDFEGVEKYIKDGYHIEQPYDGWTPLTAASWHGHAAIVEILLFAGADKERCGGAGLSPLYIACLKGHVKIVKTLLDAGADREFLSRQGMTPLSGASWRGHAAVIELLLTYFP